MTSNIGENKIAVISYPVEHAGIFALYLACIITAVQAIEQGYTPIIDLQHSCSQYCKDGRVFKDNVWEYFFKQPAGLSLNDIKDDDKVIQKIYQEYPFELHNTYNVNQIPFMYKIPTAQERDIIENNIACHNLHKYLKFSDEVISYINSKYESIIGTETEILGIVLRGTDYVSLRPFGHNIQPSTKTLIKEAKELISKYGYKKIWVATEDKNIYEIFKKEFKDILIPNIQYMYNISDEDKNKYLSDVKTKRPNHNYELGMEYILSMYILSKCKAMIGGINGASRFVFYLSNFYKNMQYVHLHNVGLYGVLKQVKYKNIWQKIFSVRNEISENIVRKVITILGFKIKVIKKIME